MSHRLLQRDHPRSFALVAKSHTLILRYSESVSGHGSSKSNSVQTTPTTRCMVDFVATHDVDFVDYREAFPSSVHGTLGLVGLRQDAFLCVITGATRVAELRPGETVEQITGVEFCE